MAESVFTKIINREIPAEIIYEDDVCIAFLNIRANHVGHTMVVTKQPIEDWLELDKPTLDHLIWVSQAIAKLHKQLYKPVRVELSIVGLEVAHVHIHIFGVNKIQDTVFSSAYEPSAKELKTEGQKLRTIIEKQGGIKV